MDKQTFSEAVQRMERSLYRVAMSYTGNVPDAADAVQEALLRAWRRRDTLRDERYFDTWLMRVVINESKDAAAQEAAYAAMAQPPEPGAAEPPGADAALHEALFSLPPHYRLPLTLTCLEGYTMREAAHMLGVPEGTVKARVHRRATATQGAAGRGGNGRCVKKIWTVPSGKRRPRSPNG